MIEDNRCTCGAETYRPEQTGQRKRRLYCMTCNRVVQRCDCPDPATILDDAISESIATTPPKQKGKR